MIISSVQAGTSIFAGFVTFALIGSIAHDTNRPVTELVESGKCVSCKKKVGMIRKHHNLQTADHKYMKQ